MLVDYVTGEVEWHWLTCPNGHRYKALADEWIDCPVCGAERERHDDA